MSIPEIRPYLESKLKADPSIPAKSIDVQFDLLLAQVFEKLSTISQFFARRALIGAKMPQRAPMHFLISSRPEPTIEETFNTSIMKSVTRALVLNGELALDNDIRQYLEGEISRIFKERKMTNV
ncbi:hypothetical protein AX14_013537 [Amanita brunnescens Koide BX004]|nr:hypothetical protein AX14_013537 [Amanita brunnescens Koide BX004]